jgi:hypothetical protein
VPGDITDFLNMGLEMPDGKLRPATSIAPFQISSELEVDICVGQTFMMDERWENNALHYFLGAQNVKIYAGGVRYTWGDRNHGMTCLL